MDTWTFVEWLEFTVQLCLLPGLMFVCWLGGPASDSVYTATWGMYKDGPFRLGPDESLIQELPVMLLGSGFMTLIGGIYYGPLVFATYVLECILVLRTIGMAEWMIFMVPLSIWAGIWVAKHMARWLDNLLGFDDNGVFSTVYGVLTVVFTLYACHQAVKGAKAISAKMRTPNNY